MTPRQQLAPFSIRVFLPSGTPDGIKIVEKSNWVGRAIAGPRSRFDELRTRPEFSKTGVYVLTGQPDPDGLPSVYIGEGDPVADRIISHYKLKDFWSSAVFFINNGKDDHLNKAHVQYLEAASSALQRTRSDVPWRTPTYPNDPHCPRWIQRTWMCSSNRCC